MDRGLIVWRELTTQYLGRLIKGSYTVSRDGLMIVRTAGGNEKTAELDGTPQIDIAERLLRELAAEAKIIPT